jgi:CheY-like chemotaxis protein
VLLATGPDEFAGNFEAVLEEAGCQVELATTGEQVAAAMQANFQVVFLDLDLPDVDGMAVLQELVAGRDSAAPAVVLLKGEGEPVHVIQRGLDLGASGYVLKHRFPAGASVEAITDLFRSIGQQPDGSPNRRSPGGRPDGCPYSASLQYESCATFLPIASGTHVSCSHLRIGTADTWRLYPRCAIGDESARAKYLRDQNA